MKLIGLIVANLLVSKLIMSKYSRLCTRNIFLRRYSNSKLDNNTAWSFRTCSYSVRAITQYLRKTPNCFKLTQILWCCLFNSKFYHLANNGRRKKALPLSPDNWSICVHCSTAFFPVLYFKFVFPTWTNCDMDSARICCMSEGCNFYTLSPCFLPPPLSPPNLRTVAKIYNYHGWLRDNWILKI